MTNGVGVNLVAPYSIEALHYDMDPYKDVRNLSEEGCDTPGMFAEGTGWNGAGIGTVVVVYLADIKFYSKNALTYIE